MGGFDFFVKEGRLGFVCLGCGRGGGCFIWVSAVGWGVGRVKEKVI